MIPIGRNTNSICVSKLMPPDMHLTLHTRYLLSSGGSSISCVPAEIFHFKQSAKLKSSFLFYNMCLLYDC